MAAHGPKPHWTEDELAILRSNYGRIKTKEIVALLPRRSMNKIYQMAYRLKLKGNKTLSSTKYHHTRHDYFFAPNVENSYWAGFMGSDGCVFGPKMVQFFQSDRKVVERFAEAINYLGPIRSKVSPLSPRPGYSVTVYSRQMVQDLFRVYSIVPAKSLILQPPSLTQLDHHLAYITGYIDGNGYVSITAKSLLVIGVVGGHDILAWIQSLLGGSLRVKMESANRLIVSKNPIWSLRWTCSKAGHLFDTLSQVSGLVELRLKRKWGKVASNQLARAH